MTVVFNQVQARVGVTPRSTNDLEMSRVTSFTSKYPLFSGKKNLNQNMKNSKLFRPFFALFF